MYRIVLDLYEHVSEAEAIELAQELQDVNAFGILPRVEKLSTANGEFGDTGFKCLERSPQL